ncbi:hypothetical protein L1987_86364 [Smallanthus sonchifolius]|uniref:Uncharacterized protein n=1 Tax=Smallanthus sonchifolius TaxID=185202 RepID=A0ACB8XZR5_9ASTR|nr:hypothetical protein L1987_86364 [Smallanthus sonchifolius]
MLSSSISATMIVTRLLIFLFISTAVNSTFNLPKSDMNLLEFPLNLEYFEAEYFLFGSMGKGLDTIEPDLATAGPPPIGAQQANLSLLTHLQTVMNAAFEIPLSPPFDPYANDINYLISCYVIPYVGLTGYVGANPKLRSPISRKLVAGLLGVESGQDAVIRSLLYERANEKVVPYETTVAEFTQKISQLRDKLGNSGLKDEGLKVPIELGAEKKTQGNVLAGDEDSLAYGRTPQEILRIVYGTGDEHAPGGFYPNGGHGVIAKRYLNR